MEHLWAPWRMQYVVQDKSNDCIFCSLPQSSEDEKNRILFRGKTCFVIMNIYPYNNGHIMVSPFKHSNCITKLDNEELNELGTLTQHCVRLLSEVYAPDGFNIGLNLGKVAGAGFDEHLHNHIVPRWAGDTNFMPIIGETKVHPEHLKGTYDKLLPLFQNLT